MRERDPDTVALERVVQYPEPGPHMLPVDAWIENRRLEDFLRTALQTQSAGTIAARYGLQCTPRDLEAGCIDCFSCHTTIREWALGTVWIPAPVEVLKCVDYGEVLVHAEIGPKSAVKAMTYWKTSPEVREDMKRLRHEGR